MPRCHSDPHRGEGSKGGPVGTLLDTEWGERLTCETVERRADRGSVAVLKKVGTDKIGIHSDRAVIGRLQPRRWLGADEIGLGLSDVRHDRGYVEQLGDLVMSPGISDHHSTVGVPTEEHGAIDLRYRLSAGLHVVI